MALMGADILFYPTAIGTEPQVGDRQLVPCCVVISWTVTPGGQPRCGPSSSKTSVIVLTVVSLV